MAFQPEEDLSCPICQDIFKDPVVLSCSHSFCKDCLRSWFTAMPTKECPVCKRRSSRNDPPANLALRNLCESFTEQRKRALSDEELCKLHQEKLKLFCLNHQQPVCVVCRDSKAHENHHFRPIEEAAQDLKEELNKSLQPLMDKLQRANKLKQKYDKAAARIKNQALYTEKKIEEQFIKLHMFLLEEEEARIRALKEEEQQKSQRMKDKMAAVSREIEALSETIRATEEQLRAADVSFLLRYKAAVEKVQGLPVVVELGPGALIDQAKHLGNLGFHIWTNMKRLVQYTPVILDPNTAEHAEISDDLTSFTQRQRQPETAEKVGTMVYGSEGFDSGSHSWDVEVGDNNDWVVGVIFTDDDTEERAEGVVQVHDMKCWGISFSDGKYKAGLFSEKSEVSLNIESPPQKIRFHLDCDKRELTFNDADTNTHIHSLTEIHQKKLFPFFFTRSKSQITILPQQI